MNIAHPTPVDIAQGIRRLSRTMGGLSHFSARRNAVDRYQGIGIRADVEAMFDPSLLKQITVDTLPVAGKVIDTRYSVYRDAPLRSYSVDIEPSVWGNRDRIMPVFERLTGLLGTEALVVTVDQPDSEEDTREGEAGKLHLVLLTEFEPVFVGDDPEPIGVAYPVHTNAMADAQEQVWECWTDALRIRVDGAGRVLTPAEEEVNPYGVVPVVFAHRGHQMGASWWRPVAQDMLEAQTTYNVLGTQHNAGLLFQALGQAVATGSMETDQIKLGANRVVTMHDPQARFEMIAPPGQLTQIMDAQRWKMDALCFRYGIKAKWADAGGATSGEHQRLLEIELSNSIGSDFAAWRNVERDLHEVCRAVAAAHSLGDLGELLSVDFVEPNVPLSDMEKRERWKFEYENGLATKADYFRLTNPDISDEQVAEKLGAVIQERQTDLTAPPVRQPGLADLLAAPVS